MSKKTLYFDSFCGYKVSVITENGKMTEFEFEKTESGRIVGNIYKGRVESILPGMQAAFVNCGLERNCYLSAETILPEGEKYENVAAELPAVKEGDEILVQVVKAPVGKKGAKVTIHPSFVGLALVYLPETPFVGVSRKIADEELRNNLVFQAEKLKQSSEGLIVRTAAPYSRRDIIETEYRYFKQLYSEIKKSFKTAKVGDLLYTDFSLPVRVLRDTLFNDIDNIIVGSDELLKKVEELIRMYPPRRRLPVKLHNTGRDMLDELGLSEQVYSLISPRVPLDNGAHIVIEKTEALTVIDVNTGKFTGDDSLEQTVYYTNILAAREIARQVKLRNIGGIVVVDFIDMQSAAHKKSLVEELERALKRDKAKCVVSPMSKFGLVEFTRKRTGASPLSLMTKPCKYCNEARYTPTAEYIILGLRAKLINAVKDGANSVRVDMNAEVLARLDGWQEFKDDLRAHCGGSVKIYAVPHRTYHEEQLTFRTDKFDIPSDTVELI